VLATVATAACAGPLVTPGSAAVVAVPIGDFTRPTDVVAAPGSPELLFVVERGGLIEVIRDREELERPFLRLTDLVRAVPDPGADAEQGLLSMAFAPDYADSGLFYVCFTNADGDVEVDEFSRSPASDVRADRSSRRTVLTVEHRAAPNHNGGLLQFRGNRHLLYLGIGDGGAGQRANAPNLESLLGKLLRIDPRERGSQPYRIPPSNPFVGRPGRDEIFAYGLRNPWRYSFDGGRIAIADVGLASEEEVDLLRLGDAAGANFGWPEFEGNSPFDPSLPGADPVTFPVHTYTHTGGACAITGGYVVRDPTITELAGRYVYGDFCTGELRSFKPVFTGGEVVARDDAPVGITADGLVSFGEAADGSLYIAQLSGAVSALEQTSAPSAVRAPSEPSGPSQGSSMLARVTEAITAGTGLPGRHSRAR
jgi:glucose/arabinose dehydrogenase